MALGLSTDKKMTRGERNFNPGNIKKSAARWAGLADYQTDPDFVTFKSPEYGIRAMCRILLTYGDRGDNTVAKIIATWAPVSENDTAAYIADVCQRCGVTADTPLDVDQVSVMRPLVQGIIWHENGSLPYTQAVIDDGLRLAGIADMPPPAVLASATTKGAGIAGIGTGVVAVTEAIQQAQQVRDTVDQARDLFQWALHYGPWFAMACVAGGIGWIIYDHLGKRRRLGV